MTSRTTHIRRLISAPRDRVYQMLIDPAALARWKVPDNMTLEVHHFEPVEGGTLRVSLTYNDHGDGKSGEHTDTYHGRLVRLIPNEMIVEEDEFETDDPDLRGVMTITYRLSDAEGGTLLDATHDGLPRGVSLEDNEKGWTMAIDKLAALLGENNHGA